MVRVDFVYIFRMNWGFLEVSLAKRFRTPKVIAWRVPGVWVLSFQTYFNFCPFFLNTPNRKSPSGDQLIFMSRKGDSSFVASSTLSYCAGIGEFSSVIHIYAETKKITLQGDVKKFGYVWYDSTQMANIFGFSLLSNKHHITYNNW